MERSSQATVEMIVRTIANTAIANEAYFSELDAVVGDGDFGYSLARGFEKLLEEWDTIDRSTIGAFLKKTAMIVISRIGGTSGPIWGTGFMRAGTVAGNKTELTNEDVIAMLRSGVEGIKARGQSDLGDKTLLDALIPTVDRLEQVLSSGGGAAAALEQAAQVARESAEATRSMVAKRGRAAYSGERSIGTLDAGAVAVAVLFEAIHSMWKQETQ
jgi:dihydroxyacetone kinase/dihydroxyacetone kinase-like protein